MNNMWSEKWLQKCSLQPEAWAGAPWWPVVVPWASEVPWAAVVVVDHPRLHLTLTPRKLFHPPPLSNKWLFFFTFSFFPSEKKKNEENKNSFSKTEFWYAATLLERRTFSFITRSVFLFPVNVKRTLQRIVLMNKAKHELVTKWKLLISYLSIYIRFPSLKREAIKYLRCPTHFKNF